MLDEIRRLLAKAPGPAPWYWRSYPTFRSGSRTWSWSRETAPVETWPVLRSDWDSLPRFAPAAYAYTVDAGSGHMLVWRAALSGAVDLRLYRVDALGPIPLRDTAWPKSNVVRGAALERMRLPRLSPGVHDGYTPRTPVDIDELLILAAAPTQNNDDSALAIYSWEPAHGTVTVLPQRWLTPATHDLGYEWVTQVARNPRTGRIVGDGIRLGTFELDDDGMTVRTWLTGAWGELLDDGRSSV